MVGMDFYSAYRQGFVRVAACTLHTALADPAANAESVLEMARDCHDDSVALAVFPELTLSGYSIEDILLQDALLDAVRRRCARWWRRPRDLLPVLVVGAPLRLPAPDLQHRGRHPPRPGPRRRAQVVPADLPGVLRAPSDGRRATTCAARIRIGGRRRAVRARPAVRRDRRARLRAARRDLRGHVRAGPAECRGRAGRCDGAGQPVRQPDHDRPRRGPRLLARSASARCLAAYVYAAAGEGESTTDLAWDGQTMIWENGVLLAKSERFPEGRAALGRRRRPRTAARRAAADGHLRRQPRPSRHHAPRRSGGWSSCSTRRPETSVCAAGRAVPVRARGSHTAGTGLLRGLQHPGRRAGAAAARAGHPKVVIGVSGGLDSTHALIVAARRWIGWAGRAATSWRSRCLGSRPATAPRATRFGSARRSV